MVNSIAGIYRRKKCDSIIVVGGGSPMDTAKGVNILVSMNDDDLMKYSGAGRINRKLKPLIAVPTTSGTGSEVTLVAVIADHDRKRKMLFTSYYLLPDAAVLDPRMTATLPPHLTASTGMDALTHACEAYTCLGKNPLSDSMALSAIRAISENLMTAVRKPGDMKARLALAVASNMAGQAFSNSMVGMVHTLGHSLGAVCGVPHGTAMSVLLPYGLEYNLHRSGKFTGELLWALAGPAVYSATTAGERPYRTIEFIRNLNNELYEATRGRHARSLREVKDSNGRELIMRHSLPDAAWIAMGDGSVVYNPEELSYDDALMVLECAYDGKPLDPKRTNKGGMGMDNLYPFSLIRRDDSAGEAPFPRWPFGGN
jgi:alcohol dehydrogenase